MLVEEGCQPLAGLFGSPSKAWVECQELGLHVRSYLKARDPLVVPLAGVESIQHTISLSGDTFLEELQTSCIHLVLYCDFEARL